MFGYRSSRDDLRLAMSSYLSIDLEDEKSAALLSAPPISRRVGFPTVKRYVLGLEKSFQSIMGLHVAQEEKCGRSIPIQ